MNAGLVSISYCGRGWDGWRGEKHPLGGDRALRRGPGAIDDLIAPGLDWAGPRLFIIDDAKPLSDTIRLFWACLSNPHREPRPALPEAYEVPSRASPCQAGRLGSGAGGNSCVEADPTRSLRSESGCTDKCSGHTEREWLAP
jgi:hypothetical protein